MKEKPRKDASGFAYLILFFLIVVGSIWQIIESARRVASLSGNPLMVFVWLVVMALALLCLKGLFGVQPNQGVVLQLFGHYIGTERTPGLRWANPLYSKRVISLRTRNFETGHLKVNDKDGNPIEFAAIVVWGGVDNPEAGFRGDQYDSYVQV